MPTASNLIWGARPAALKTGHLKLLKQMTDTVFNEDDSLDQDFDVELLLDLLEVLIHIRELRPVWGLPKPLLDCHKQEVSHKLEKVGLMNVPDIFFLFGLSLLGISLFFLSLLLFFLIFLEYFRGDGHFKRETVVGIEYKHGCEGGSNEASNIGYNSWDLLYLSLIVVGYCAPMKDKGRTERRVYCPKCHFSQGISEGIAFNSLQAWIGPYRIITGHLVFW